MLLSMKKDIDPDYANTLLLFANALNEMGEYDEAHKCALKVIGSFDLES